MEQQTNNNYSSKILQEKIDQLKERMENKRKEMDDLEKENPIITTYKGYQRELEDLANECKKYEQTQIALYQSECPHPLWYFWYESDDIHFIDGKVCKCIRCERENKFSDKEFNELKNGKLIDVKNRDNKPSFESIQNEFHTLESEGHSQEEITKMMYEKYVVNKENNRTR